MVRVNAILPSTDVVNNLGVYFDSELLIERQVSRLCQVCYFHLRRLRTVRRSLTKESLLTLAHAFVTSLLIGTKQQRLKFSDLTNLSLSNDIIPVSSSARNLGFIFDSDMSFSNQIKSVSKSCHFHIRDIRRIRHLLPLSAATALANSLVSSKLDYCNSLYSGISQANLNKLQRIQNSLARVITNTSKYQHITPILKKLHWLPIKQRIDYKLCLLTYKTLTNQQPTYLYNSLSFPSHSVSTRSSDSLVLSIPYVRSSLGKRAFSVIGPRLWNSLPPDTRNSSSLPIFRSKLKTHLFKIAFPP